MIKLPIPSYSLVGCVAAGALLTGFGSGWYVQGLRWDASLLKAQKAVVRVVLKQQGAIDKEATTYETERANEVQRQIVYQDRIRTIFRDRVIPAECAAPDDVVGVLTSAVNSANSRAVGQSGGELPAAPNAPEPIDRPRAVSLGSNDDRALWRLREPTLPIGQGVAEEPLAIEPLPDPAFGQADSSTR